MHFFVVFLLILDCKQTGISPFSHNEMKYLICFWLKKMVEYLHHTVQGFFLGKNFRGGGGETNVSRNRGGHRLELKYIMYFVASASLAYSSCLILHSCLC